MEINESDAGWRRWKEVFWWPGRGGEIGGRINDCVGGKTVPAKAGVESSERRIVEGTVRGTTTGGPHWSFAGIYDAVREDEVLHRPTGGDSVTDEEERPQRKSGYVVDGHILKRGATIHGDLRKFTWAVVLRTVNVIDYRVMDAVALPVEGDAAVRWDIGNL